MINSPSYSNLPDNIDIDSPFAMPLIFNYLMINNGVVGNGTSFDFDLNLSSTEFSIYETADTSLTNPLLSSPYNYVYVNGPIIKYYIDDVADLAIGSYYYRMKFIYSDGKYPEIKVCGKLTITTKGSTLKRFGDISKGTAID